jgi:hypothetical protein
VFNYADPVNGCYIAINGDILRGNKSTIIKAIKSIKSDDYQEYKNMCSKVSKIYERKCSTHNPVTRELTDANQTGCVISGTRTIFIYPQNEDTPQVIEKRADTIIKLINL